MSATEFSDLRESIAPLQQSLATLQMTYGDAFAIRRLMNDADRLAIDTEELEGSPPPKIARKEAEKIYVPDSKSDESAWMGAQDEGLGFHSRERTK